MTKIYTKTGDLGETGLIGGKRIFKDDVLLEAYGTVDELNAILGVVRSEGPDKRIDQWLNRIQAELFEVGADLASPFPDETTDKTPDKTNDKIKRIGKEKAAQLEKEIDLVEKELEPLKSFVLPGGSKSSVFLHLARTVCRRAERRIAILMKKDEVNPEILTYMNRLSDWLFVMARYINKKAQIPDVPWRPNV